MPNSSPEWEDIVPIKQDDGPLPLAVIQYPPGFEDTHDIFRAIQIADEYSERALRLTADVIECNSANYTAWYFRRRCLSALKSNLEEELSLTDRWALQNAKNYQVWYHRRWLIAELAKQNEEVWCMALGRRELEFHLDAMKDNDDFKNYNGWSHRQFIVQKFGLWGGEIAFVEKLLEEDICNNSAWNHRYTVIRNAHWPLSEAVRQAELDFTIAALKRHPNNESAWNYLSAFFGEGDGRESWDRRPEVEALCLDFVSSSQDSTCRFAIETLTHILEAKGEMAKAKDQYSVLENVDAIRAPYWHWRAALAQEKVVF